MSVKINRVVPASVCYKKGIRSGDTLLSLNGNSINDVLDYRFYADSEKIKIGYINGRGHEKHAVIRNVSSCDDLGLEFDTYLMDKHRSCKNHCIFCFIDQLPDGMRESLYFKDDDSRLSFLFGNYITLTNLSEQDVERIISMHISPLNASIHTMNPSLRVKMMKNPHAGEVLSLLNRFSDAGIIINAQLVLCPGINDGKELEFSLSELSKISGVESIAAVPVGLTVYREGLYPLRPFTREEACRVIDTIDSFNETLLENGVDKLAYPSDEFYQIACRCLPDDEYYGDYPQLDNGVGLCTYTKKKFYEDMSSVEADDKYRCFSVATGKAAFSLIGELAEAFSKKFTNSNIDVHQIENKFFGKNVTVSGLITGSDLINALKERSIKSQILLIPSVMLKSSSEPVFLDDVTVEDVEKELNVKVHITDCNSFDLFNSFYSETD